MQAAAVLTFFMFRTLTKSGKKTRRKQKLIKQYENMTLEMYKTIFVVVFELFQNSMNKCVL